MGWWGWNTVKPSEQQRTPTARKEVWCVGEGLRNPKGAENREDDVVDPKPKFRWFD